MRPQPSHKHQSNSNSPIQPNTYTATAQSPAPITALLVDQNLPNFLLNPVEIAVDQVCFRFSTS